MSRLLSTPSLWWHPFCGLCNLSQWWLTLVRGNCSFTVTVLKPPLAPFLLSSLRFAGGCRGGAAHLEGAGHPCVPPHWALRCGWHWKPHWQDPAGLRPASVTSGEGQHPHQESCAVHLHLRDHRYPDLHLWSLIYLFSVLALKRSRTIKACYFCFSWYLLGLPKAAVINHERLWMATFLQSLAGVRSDDVIYIFLPLYHSSGFLMGLCGAINQGDSQHHKTSKHDYQSALWVYWRLS